MNCEKCGSPTKVVPAGVSKKTGKPYSSFTACSNRGCDWILREKKQTIQTSDNKSEFYKKIDTIYDKVLWMASQMSKKAVPVHDVDDFPA